MREHTTRDVLRYLQRRDGGWPTCDQWRVVVVKPRRGKVGLTDPIALRCFFRVDFSPASWAMGNEQVPIASGDLATVVEHALEQLRAKHAHRMDLARATHAKRTALSNREQ